MRPWREACEEALRAHTEADAIRFWQRAHETPSGPRPIFDYRFEHTLAAVKAARWLSRETGADLEVLECAAWLHDCRKRLKDPLTKDAHAQDAAAAVAGILEGTDFPEAKQDAVRHAILHHVGLCLKRRLEPLETACLWDADKLSKLGAASLVHFQCISGAFQPIDTEGILGRGEKWLELARMITGCMNTRPAREEAERRLEFLVTYYGRLRREWSDPLETGLP